MNKQIFEGKKTPDFSFSPSPTREKSQPTHEKWKVVSSKRVKNGFDRALEYIRAPARRCKGGRPNS